MREEFYVETSDGVTSVSANLVNSISQYLIAQTGTEEELTDLVIAKMHEQNARKEAFKRAYEEIPVPIGRVPLEVRRDIQIRRNELAEKYFEEFLNR